MAYTLRHSADKKDSEKGSSIMMLKVRQEKVQVVFGGAEQVEFAFDTLVRARDIFLINWWLLCQPTTIADADKESEASP